MANNRRLAREYALKMLFALKLDSSQKDPQTLLESFWEHFRFADDVLGEPLNPSDVCLTTATRLFAETLVRGVIESRAVLDEIIAGVARNWSLERMPAVDLTILRMATYELLYQPETPARVTINEAIEIAKRYGSKESPPFVNGLLDKIAQMHSAGTEKPVRNHL